MKATAYHDPPSVLRAIFQALRNATVRGLRLGPAAVYCLSLLGACTHPLAGNVGGAMGKKYPPDGRLFVRTVQPGLALANAGVEVDDEILTIDGKDVRPMSQPDVESALRGDTGKTLVLTIAREGQKREVKVVLTPKVAPKKRGEP